MIDSTLFAALWLANGLRKAVFKPRIQYLEHSDVKGAGTFVKVKRQELLPPWRTIDEVWFVPVGGKRVPVRERDGKVASGIDDDRSYLGDRIVWVLHTAEVRNRETDELLKEEARRAN